MLHAGLNARKITSALQQDLKAVVDQLLEQRPLPESLFQDIFVPIFEKIPKDPFEWIETLRALYLVSIASTASSEYDHFKSLISEYLLKVKHFRSCPKMQLIEAYESLIKHELQISSAEITPHTQPSGAAIFEPDGHLSWGQVPMGRYHPELGVIWLYLGQTSNNPRLIKNAMQIGSWELAASQNDYSPFPGLFCNEADYDFAELIAWRSLLFSMLLNHTGDEKYRAPLQQSELLLADQYIRDPLISYLQKKTPKPLEPDGQKPHYTPSALLCQKDLDLYGWRDPDLSLYFTTSGGGSGLGGFTYKSLEVITYAPHLYPLNEAHGFGINTMPRNNGTFRSSVNTNERSISCHGICRLSDVTIQDERAELEDIVNTISWNRFRMASPQNTWLDVTQSLKGNLLEIDTLLLNFDKPPDLSFTFFVKAEAVKMDEIVAIPNQLRHFVVEVSSLEILGENCSIRLFQHVDNIPLEKYSVEVIPLGGNRAFWGADFLISFLYKNPKQRNRWTLELA
jgi:hypothetical protein